MKGDINAETCKDEMEPAIRKAGQRVEQSVVMTVRPVET